MSLQTLAIYGKESEPYNTYVAHSPAPGDNGSGGQVAQRGEWPMGTQLILQDGRKFRFTLAGGTTLVVGNVITSAAILTTDQDMTPAAGEINDRIITFTHGAATTVINLFAEGFVFVTITPGFADNYRIASHAALRNATAGDILNLAPGQALRRAITTITRISLQRHPYDGVIQAAATTLTGAPVGVAVAAITNAQFGWLQTRGVAVALVAGTAVVGANAVSPTGTAGAAGPSGASTSVNIGIFLQVEATTQAGPVFLRIDG